MSKSINNVAAIVYTYRKIPYLDSLPRYVDFVYFSRNSTPTRYILFNTENIDSFLFHHGLRTNFENSNEIFQALDRTIRYCPFQRIYISYIYTNTLSFFNRSDIITVSIDSFLSENKIHKKWLDYRQCKKAIGHMNSALDDRILLGVDYE